MNIQDIINSFKSGVNPATELGVGGEGQYFFFFTDSTKSEEEQGELLYNVKLTGNYSDDYIEVEGEIYVMSNLLLCTYRIYSDERTEFKSIKLSSPATCSIVEALSEVKSWYNSLPEDWKFQELIQA